MADTHLNTRVDTVRRLARRGALPALAKVVAKTRAEDLAAVIAHLAPHEQRTVFSQVADDEMAADVLVRVSPEDFQFLADAIPTDRVATLFSHMAADDQTDLLELLPEERREAVLARIHHEEREQVEELLGWPPDSAGGIMSPLAFRLTDSTTCRDAIAQVQEASDHELIYYIYVLNGDEQLCGVTSLRSLLTHPPSARLGDIMMTEVITVRPEVDQEEVARIAGRYDLLAVPVVDENRRLLGIVTVDDVIDVIREEAAEDMLLMAGVNEEAEGAPQTRLHTLMRRVPWLLVTVVGGIAISEIIEAFNPILEAQLVLAGFIPIVMGMEGNVGIQSATVTVRNIALGKLDSGVLRPMLGEMRNGLAMGVVFSVVIGGYCLARYQDPRVALSVATAIVAGMTTASLVGAAVPLTLRRFGVDPAIATGPFVTTAMDGVGLSIYLGIASLLLSHG